VNENSFPVDSFGSQFNSAVIVNTQNFESFQKVIRSGLPIVPVGYAASLVPKLTGGAINEIRAASHVGTSKQISPHNDSIHVSTYDSTPVSTHAATKAKGLALSKILNRNVIEHSAIRAVAYGVFAHWICSMRIGSKLRGEAVPGLSRITLQGILPCMLQRGFSYLLFQAALKGRNQLQHSLRALVPEKIKALTPLISNGGFALPLALEELLATQFCHSKIMNKDFQPGLPLVSLAVVWLISAAALQLTDTVSDGNVTGCQSSDEHSLVGKTPVSDLSITSSGLVGNRPLKKTNGMIAFANKHPELSFLLMLGVVDGVVDYLVSRQTKPKALATASEELGSMLAYLGLGLVTQMIFSQSEKIMAHFYSATVNEKSKKP